MSSPVSSPSTTPSSGASVRMVSIWVNRRVEPSSKVTVPADAPASLASRTALMEATSAPRRSSTSLSVVSSGPLPPTTTSPAPSAAEVTMNVSSPPSPNRVSAPSPPMRTSAPPSPSPRNCATLPTLPSIWPPGSSSCVIPSRSTVRMTSSKSEPPSSSNARRTASVSVWVARTAPSSSDQIVRPPTVIPTRRLSPASRPRSKSFPTLPS